MYDTFLVSVGRIRMGYGGITHYALTSTSQTEVKDFCIYSNFYNVGSN